METTIFSLKYSNVKNDGEVFQHVREKKEGELFIDILQLDKFGNIYDSFGGAYVKNENDLVEYINENFSFSSTGKITLIQSEITNLLEIKNCNLIKTQLNLNKSSRVLKTTTVKKRMNLLELLEYSWENEIKNKKFISDCGTVKVEFGSESELVLNENNVIVNQDTFIVEKEEEITMKTNFDTLVIIDRSGDTSVLKNTCMDNFMDNAIVKVYAKLNDDLHLIYNHDTTYIIDFTDGYILPSEYDDYSNEYDTVVEMEKEFKYFVDKYLEDYLYLQTIHSPFEEDRKAFQQAKNYSFNEKIKILGWKIIEQKY